MARRLWEVVMEREPEPGQPIRYVDTAWAASVERATRTVRDRAVMATGLHGWRFERAHVVPLEGDTKRGRE